MSLSVCQCVCVCVCPNPEYEHQNPVCWSHLGIMVTFGNHVLIKPLYSTCTLKLQWQTHIQLVHYSPDWSVHYLVHFQTALYTCLIL